MAKSGNEREIATEGENGERSLKMQLKWLMKAA